MQKFFRNQLPLLNYLGFLPSKAPSLEIDTQLIVIRNATPQDIPEMMRLAKSSEGAAQWSEQQYRSLFLANNAVTSALTLVAQSPGTSVIAGFLTARRVAPELELENVVVAQEARGSGIGIRLMREFLNRAQQSNSEAVFLEVRESNSAARALYKRVGFSETGRRKSYYNNPLEDAILYAKKF